MMITIFLVVVGLTILIEAAILVPILRQHWQRALVAVILVNLCTVPLANYAFQIWLPSFWIVEGVVVIIESLLLWQLLRIFLWRATLLALLVNAASALIGRLVFW